jgi:hypothetical protein
VTRASASRPEAGAAIGRLTTVVIPCLTGDARWFAGSRHAVWRTGRDIFGVFLGRQVPPAADDAARTAVAPLDGPRVPR